MLSDRAVAIEDVLQANQDEVENLLSKDEGEGAAEDEEDFFLKGPSGKKTVRFATDKLKDVKVQIAEVTDAMRDNVGRLLERGDQLDHLHDRSQGLASSSDQFRTSATRLRRTTWWHNTRTRLLVVAAATGLVLLILIPIIVKMNV